MRLPFQVQTIARRFFVPLALTAAYACNPAPSADAEGEGPGASENEEGGAEARDEEEQAEYAIVSRVTLPTGGSTVIAVIDSLKKQSVDVERSLEVPGQAAALGSPLLPGELFVAGTERAEITRYTFSQESGFSARGTLSLASHGLSRSPRTFVIASPTSAYAISAETYQVFKWNPSTMELASVINLPASLKREGYAPAWVFKADVRDDELLIPIAWVRQGGNPGTAPESAMVMIDLASDQVRVVEESRCGGLRSVFPAAGGKLWFASTAGAPATWQRMFGSQAGSEPCLIRLREDENAIDGDFIARPAALAEGKLAVDFSPAGPEHLVYQALDEQLFKLSASVTPEEAWSAAAWRFYSIPSSVLEESSGTVEPMQIDLPPSALNALRFHVDGRDFIPRIQEDYSKTTLVDVTDPAHLVEGPSIVGSVGNVFRIR